jgi:6-phosphogluconate dehydrogenase
MAKKKPKADVGLIGLAVMGQNLVLNMADHGFKVAVYNRTTETTEKFVAANPDTPGGIVGFKSVKKMVRKLSRPRKIVILVKAGSPVDSVIDQLVPLLEKGDVIIDGGNSLWTDTIRREKSLNKHGLHFVGSGVSGGEEGARFGPSLMPGGSREAWNVIKPIWTAVAAKVDAKTGKPKEGALPGKPVRGGVPCTTYIGTDGSGHYVKMVHNGIEYGDMQLISEAYYLLKHLLRLRPNELSKIFAKWNAGDLDSFLIEITADILQQRDPVNRRRYLVDSVLDSAGQKGTGRWTSVSALELGVPAATIAEAVFARTMSAIKEERVAASKTLRGPKFRYRGLVRPGLRADGRGPEGVRLEPRLRSDRHDLAWRVHHPCSLPAKDHRRLPPKEDPSQPAARPLLQGKALRRPGQLAARGFVGRRGRNRLPCLHERAGLLRQLSFGNAARQPTPGPAGLFRCAQLRAGR